MARCRLLAGDDAEVTLVFDKGYNRQANLERVADQHLYFVGGLVPSQRWIPGTVPRGQRYLTRY